MPKDVKQLYRLPCVPVLQNRLYDTRDEALECPTGDVSLVQNLTTGLIYNEAFRPELVVYDSSYQNEQGVSRAFQNHLQQVLKIIEREMGKTNIVEVGCGKGLFLELLQKNGFEITGFDPTYEGNNPRVLRHFFEPGVGIQGKGLILRHVLEHIPDPVSFLENLHVANGGGGRVYIEVPCFDWICKHRNWLDVFYEHVNYFRLSDFDRIFGSVVESGRIFGGQYLYIVADLASVRRPVRDENEQFNFPSDFSVGIRKEDPYWSPSAAVWGGASKGVIFSLMKERSGRPIKTIIDINPAKQGKYLPLSGLLVQAPEDALQSLPPMSTIYVMNSNYLEEIKCISNNKYNYITIDNE
jgi:SAM-dependent methyltransferase